jgi:nitrate reductase gamma subunit
VSAAAKQMLAIVAGGIFGLLTLVGLVLLISRRLGEPRLRTTTRTMDWLVLWLLLAQLGLGLLTLPISWEHRSGEEMVKLMTWAQHVFTFQGDAASFVADASPVFKLHLALGMTIFVVFPFSRLVHIWSGFGAVAYLTRAYQVVRSR